MEAQHDSAAVRRVLFIEGGANLVMLLVKLAVGVTTGSAAVLGDALHSFTDLANNGVALAVVRVSSRPPDADHPYGHRKYEQLAVFTLAALLTVVAFELVLHALRARDAAIARSGWGLFAMFAVLGVNVAVATWEARRARALGSDLLLADAQHTMGDIATTVVVIVGWQIAATGYVWIDRLFAIGVAGVVFYLAFGLFRRAIPVLVDEAASAPTDVQRIVANIDEVREVRRVRSRSTGEGASADVVIAVDDSLTTAQAHAVADAIETALETQLDIRDVSVHVEPLSRKPRPRSD
jgi:cation diffusion facilitator family transporter